MKIVSWNIRQGGGKRVEKIIEALLAYSAEVIVLSEFHNNNMGQLIRTRLLLAGYNFQYSTPADPKLNTVLIASKIGGGSKLFYEEVSDFPQAIVRFDLSDFDIYGLYIPHKKKNKLFPFLHDQVKDKKPSILVGDFNTGFNGIDQKGDSFWYTDEIEKILRAGYVDAFRHVYGKVKEYSWFSHQGNGYRYDHTWVHESLAERIVDCFYSHTEREAKLSDHSIMVLELRD